MILKHYLSRIAKDPINFLMLILFPLVMLTIFITTSIQGVPFELRSYNGFCIQATSMLAFNVLFFQYFGGMIVTDFLYSEFRTDIRWRLMATPKSLKSFILSAIGASIIIGAINGAIVLVVARFVFNAYFNIPITVIALLGMSAFVTLFGVLCFQIFPKKGTTTAVIMVFAFAQMLAINFGMIPAPELGEIGVVNFLPLGAASMAMNYAGGMMITLNNPELGFEAGITMFGVDMNMVLINLGILGGLIVAALAAVIIVGRKRKI
ncbi:MAG: hypothetical protein FWD05_12430 [Oscillospiraceae bacterium]|nr:hypothetical protein [Oscillospiraceae bacterium]